MTAVVTIIGNLTAAPELRFTQNGIAVASFTVASTERVFDKQTNELKDGKTLFMRCSAWRDLGEHVAGSLDKGMRVIVVGKIATSEFTTKEGDKRSSIELDVDAIGPDLKWATASVTRASSSRGAAPSPPVADVPVDDWSQPQSTPDVWSTPGTYEDSTPF